MLLTISFTSPLYAACDNSNGNTNNSKTTQIYPNTIIINEILPNPSTDETKGEFIELYNTSDTALDLTGWQLSDATDNVYTLSGSIGGKQYLAVYRSDSSIALNNSGDIVELYQPSGQLTDDMAFTETATDDTSYALDNTSDWQWTTTPTPGKKNTITNSIANNTNSTNSNSNTNQANTNNTNNTNTNPSAGAKTLQLSELLPDPEGSDSTDEWIELHNYGSTALDLKGWQIADSSKTFTITSNTSLNADGYIVFAIGQTGISLNNSGETISLLDPTQNITDSVNYGTATSGQSYARINNVWSWTTILTPGENNQASSSLTTSNDAISAIAKNLNPETKIQTLSIAQAKQAEIGSEVIVTGIVTVLPDTFGTQFFYIQDNTSGIQIFSSKKLFPELMIGDHIQVIGAVGTSNGESKLNTSTATDIVVLDHGTNLQPKVIQHYDPMTAGQLVQVTGLVQNKSGSTITLSPNWELYIRRNTGLKTSSFNSGTMLTVSGIIVANNDGIKIWPRSPEDIANATTATGATTNTALLASNVNTTTTSANTAATATPMQSNNFFPMISLVTLAGVTTLLAGLSRSAKVRQWWQQHVLPQIQNSVMQLNQWVGLRKNTMDSNVQSQYRESHPLEKKLS